MTYYFAPDETEKCLSILTALPVSADERLLIFAAESDADTLQALIAALRAQQVPFVAAVVPGVIVDGAFRLRGIAASIVPIAAPEIVLPLPIGPATIPENIRTRAAEQQPLCLVLCVNSTPQAAAMSQAAQQLEQWFGSRLPIMGGGTGSRHNIPITSIFNNTGDYSDNLLLLFINMRSEVGVEYGWERTRSFMVATRAHHNIIYEMNYQPATSVYLQEYTKVTNRTLASEEIGPLVDIHLGMLLPSGDTVMRAILATQPDGSLIMGGFVPSGSVIFMMQTTRSAMIYRASSMSRKLKRRIPNPAQAFVVGCITRLALPDDTFSDELKGVMTSLVPLPGGMIGFLALGEFGRIGVRGTLEFLNESIVLGVTQQA